MTSISESETTVYVSWMCLLGRSSPVWGTPTKTTETPNPWRVHGEMLFFIFTPYSTMNIYILNHTKYLTSISFTNSLVVLAVACLKVATRAEKTLWGSPVAVRGVRQKLPIQTASDKRSGVQVLRTLCHCLVLSILIGFRNTPAHTRFESFWIRFHALSSCSTLFDVFAHFF